MQSGKNVTPTLIAIAIALAGGSQILEFAGIHLREQILGVVGLFSLGLFGESVINQSYSNATRLWIRLAGTVSALVFFGILIGWR
jgi:hypothetical protein